MNQPIARRLAPAAILALTAVTAHAQDAGVASGHAFAREACIACHVVEPEPQKPRVVVIGRDFNTLPGLWIPPVTRRPCRHIESAEAEDSHRLSGYEGFENGLYYRLHRVGCCCLG
jgi:hypothetical protein